MNKQYRIALGALLFLAAMNAHGQGSTPPHGWYLGLDAGTIARTTWEMIESTSIRPVKDGKVFQQKSEALAHLTAMAERLLTEKREILTALGI